MLLIIMITGVIIFVLFGFAAFKDGEAKGKAEGFAEADKKMHEAARSLALLSHIKQTQALQSFQNSPEMIKVEKVLTPAPLRPKPVINWGYNLLLWSAILVWFMVLFVC